MSVSARALEDSTSWEVAYMEKIGHSIEEAAEMLGIGRSVMCDLIRDGKVRSVKIGRRRIVPADSVREYMRNLIEAQNVAGGVA